MITCISVDFVNSDCVKHIKKVKTGGKFNETSPVLNDISGATSWNKVAGVKCK